MAKIAAAQDEALKILFSDRKLTITTLLEIENKDRQLVPMILNPIQDDIIGNSSARDIYVKPAQVGFTSIIVGDFYIDNITISGTTSVIVSYDEFSAERLILKAKRYHQSLQRRISSIPKLDHKSATELSWENKETNFYSTMYIFSSGAYSIGRGEPIHNLLLDEYAFWREGTHELVFASAQNRVPLKPGTKVRIGSTANGEDNPFAEMYRAAKEGSAIGRSVYKWHFYPWFLMPEYAMLPDDMFCLPGDDTYPLPKMQSDEQKLFKTLTNLYKLDDITVYDKLRWRRYKRAEASSMLRSGRTVRVFAQEFPEDDVSCFLVSGDQAYSPDIISTKVRMCSPPYTQKTITHPRTGLSATLDIWHEVEAGRSYLIGIDPGKGKQSESVASVWTFTEGYQNKEGKDIPPQLIHCATLSGWYDEDEMSEYCKAVGYMYNVAVLATEDNLDMVSHIKDYPNLYWREDVRTGKLVRAIGWQSNTSTKPYMITEVSRNLDYIDCQDIRFWEQCRNIRRTRELKSGIEVVGADDYHDAFAIAIVCRGSMPLHIGYVGNSGDNGGWSDDWGK